MDRQTIARVIKKRGLKKIDLARVLGIEPSGVTALLKGGRLLKVDEVPKVRHFLRLDSVPLKGFASAGDRIEYYPLAEDELDRVDAPDNATENTVAIAIRGDSLGAAFNGWIAYYDHVERPITDALINQLCVLGLSDGSVQIKRVMPSRNKRFVHLVSNTGAQVSDVPKSLIEWAAKVIRMTQR